MSTLDVEIDERGRLNLGKVRAKAGRYLVSVDPDGVITLAPAEVLSKAQIRLLMRPELQATIDKYSSVEMEPSQLGRPTRVPPRD